MSMRQRSYEKELLDKDNIPFSEILPTMKELNIINTLLGGHNITRRGIDFFVAKSKNGKPLTIAEIGCGGGDNLSSINTYLTKKNIPFSLIGVDIKAECIQFATQYGIKGTTWICSDYRNVTWPDKKPDVIFSSLFCHHFTDEQLVTQLQWLKENTGLGFFINDLHRHPLAYSSIKLITKLLSKSYLVINDAPLSVKRAFKKKDWIKLFSEAGIPRYDIRWQWAFRYLICAGHE
jgi:2-polyprenyl-3-methyl-5-hydroxy-6-metoxy-1,4-benzoquinol methylase